MPQDAAAGLPAAPALAAQPLAPMAPAALPPPGRDLLPASRATRTDYLVGGGEDRMHHLAMVAGSPVPPPRMAVPGRPRTPAPVRPASRIDCMRRCGSDGFCDPSSASGCGGEYCLAGRDQV